MFSITYFKYFFSSAKRNFFFSMYYFNDFFLSAKPKFFFQLLFSMIFFDLKKNSIDGDGIKCTVARMVHEYRVHSTEYRVPST